MSIQMVGGVYCPLSHRDPQHRLYGLIEQTKSHLVLVHHVTKALFTDDIFLLDINSLLINKDVETDINASGLSKFLVTSNNVAYIIFTSGSTGIPKPVSHKIKSQFSDTFVFLINRFLFDIKISLNLYDPWFTLIYSTKMIPFYKWVDVHSIFMFKKHWEH